MWGIGMMLLFFIVLLGIGYFLYRTVTRGAFSGNDAALEELRIAYARGNSPKKSLSSVGTTSNSRSKVDLLLAISSGWIRDV